MAGQVSLRNCGQIDLGSTGFSDQYWNSAGGAFSQSFFELALEGCRAVVFKDLLPVRKDPFDRILVAQAACEVVQLWAVNEILGGYGDVVRVVERG